MKSRLNGQVSYFDADGRPRVAALQMFSEMAAERESLAGEIAALRTRLDAMAAVVAPTGGTTTDSQARTAISGLITAAAS